MPRKSMKRQSKKQIGCSAKQMGHSAKQMGHSAKQMGGDCANKQNGGDASTHTERIYGAVGQQGTAAGQGNLINSMKGGYRKSPKSPKSLKKRMGGSGIVDLVVPAVLLYGQQRYTRRSKKNVSKSK